MKYCRLFCLVGVLVISGFSGAAFAQGTAFTYQGRLLASGSTPTGTFDLRFALHPASTGTNLIGSPLTNSTVAVSNGVFTVTLDFGNVYQTSPLYLEIGVRTNGSTAAYTILAPTQLLTSAPYAVQALNAATATSAANFSGTIAASQLPTNIALLNSNEVFTGQTTFSNATGNFSGLSTGTFTGTVIGNGALVTNLNITNLIGVIQSNPNWQLLQTNNQQGVAANNYLTTNAALTGLILPANPAVGSTLQISGSGANGWKVSQTGTEAIITASMGLPAGQNWGVALSNNLAWHALACSSNGMRMAAGYASGSIYYSADGGVTWASSGSDSQAWSSIASSADGTRMVAAPNNSSQGIYTSVNGGASWTKQTGFSYTGYTVHAVASSADGFNLVAAASSGFEPIYTSSNGGTNWTPRITNNNYVSICCSADGTVIAAPCYNGQIVASQDSGATWATNGPSAQWSAIACSASGSKMVATVNNVNNGYIYTSGDFGTTWTARFGPQTWTNVTSSADGINLAAVSSAGYIYTSSDGGQTWVQRTNNLPSGTQAWSAIASSGTGSRLIAAISTGYIYSSTASTTPGTNGYLMGNQYSSAALQYIGNNQWMPISFIGNLSAF